MQVLDKKIIAKDRLQPAGRCPAFDDECHDVKNPWYCWQGAWGVGPAEGYCPILFKPDTGEAKDE